MQHGIEMHHAYSRVATNAHIGHEPPQQQVIEEVPLAQYPPTAEEINVLAEPPEEEAVVIETEIPNVQENLLVGIEPVGTECPPKATGVYPYLMDCKKYINCYKGTPTIQTCPPGTLFNPEIKYCDNPTKVKCVTLDMSQSDNTHLYDQHNAKVVQYNNNKNQNSQNKQVDVLEELPVASTRVTQVHSRVGRTQIENEYDQKRNVQNDNVYVPTCPPGSMGQLLPHPFDCAKYLHCDITGTMIKDCSPGTHFNAVMQICDWPENAQCAIQAGNYKESNAKQVDFSTGAGLIDIRLGETIQTKQQFSVQHKSSSPDVAVEELPLPSKRVSQLKSRSGRTQAETDYYDEDDSDKTPVVDGGDTYVPSCPPDAVGQHLPHPFDCAKYLHCDITGTFIRDCSPGTHFNAEMQICDWPQNVKCNIQESSGTYQQHSKKPKQLDVVGEVDNESPEYSGIGRIDVRSMSPNEGSYPGPAGAVFIPYSRSYHLRSTTPKPYVRFENGNRPTPVYTQTQREPKTQESTIVEQPVRAHQTPIYHRERYPVKVQRREFFTTSTTTTTTTERPSVAVPKQTVMSVNNYNRAYYNPKQVSN